MIILGLFFLRSWWLWFILILIITYSSQKVIRMPIKDQMPKDLLKLKKLTQRFTGRLIPWKKDEIEILSLNKIEEQISRKRGFTSSGAFASIYQEPIFSYGYKVYPTKDQIGVLYAQTEGNELFFYEYPKEVDVQINGVALGKIMEGKLYGTDGSILANFLENRMEGYTSIVIGNKDAGHILQKNEFNNDVNPRALDSVENNLNLDESVIFLAMAIWRIVKENVK